MRTTIPTSVYADCEKKIENIVRLNLSPPMMKARLQPLAHFALAHNSSTLCDHQIAQRMYTLPVVNKTFFSRTQSHGWLQIKSDIRRPERDVKYKKKMVDQEICRTQVHRWQNATVR